MFCKHDWSYCGHILYPYDDWERKYTFVCRKCRREKRILEKKMFIKFFLKTHPKCTKEEVEKCAKDYD